jgi:hypothetical protein
MINQTIFKEMYVYGLRNNLMRGNACSDYFMEEWKPEENSFFEAPIKVEPEKLNLKTTDGPSNDLENAISVYEAFPSLSEVQASDPRLWTYLTHVDLREYVMIRWPLGENKTEILSDETSKMKAVASIESHWFTTVSNDRTLRRNAISRLWWAVHLTRAPWLKDIDFFKDMKYDKDDEYRFTKVLLSKQDVYQQVLERGLGRDTRLLIVILEFIEEHSDISREQIRGFIKELNLAMSTRNFSLLTYPDMREELFKIGETILNAKITVA